LSAESRPRTRVVAETVFSWATAAPAAPGGVDQEVLGVLRAGVLEELRRHDRDRRGDILQVGADAGSGQRAVGFVASLVLGGVNDEGGQHRGLFLVGRSCGGSCCRRGGGGVCSRSGLGDRDSRHYRETKR
jgi:hypothetical protein